MDFTIIPYVGDTPLTPEDTVIRIPEKFAEYSHNLVLEVRKLTEIKNKADEQKAVEGQKRLQAVLQQIEHARTLAQAPITAIKNAIQDAARSATDELTEERVRIGGLLQAAANAEQVRRDTEIRALHEAHGREIDAKAAEVLRLEEEQQKLMISARNDEDLFRAGKTRLEAEALAQAARDAAFDLDMARETTIIEPEFKSPLIKGASTPEQIDIEIADKKLFISAVHGDFLSAKPIGLLKLFDIDLRKQSTKDLIKEIRDQNKADPNFDIKSVFADAGIKLNIYRSPRTRQASKVIRETIDDQHG